MYRPAACDASSAVVPRPRAFMYAGVRVPPVVWGVALLIGVVMLGRFTEYVRQGRNVHRQSSHSRPGSRVLISWSCHSLPSGSQNAAWL